ncbi:MAG TPA: sigma-70 family RNA polymerase sigma factor [Eudoraea sp.]|nr:sigma-70 family RNA polymerase sigma factor [Eudoraea sp.]
MSHNPDQHIIDKVLSGHTRAFEEIIERYKHMVYTLALKVVKNREDAEEVAQDVFLKGYMALKTFKGDAKFSTWLYKIAYNRSLDYVKKQKRTLVTSELNILKDHNPADLENALDNLEASERKVMIREALDALAPEDSVLVTLYYFEAMSLKEISKVTGIGANNAKVRLFRSRARLAELLKDKVAPQMSKDYGRK